MATVRILKFPMQISTANEPGSTMQPDNRKANKFDFAGYSAYHRNGILKGRRDRGFENQCQPGRVCCRWSSLRTSINRVVSFKTHICAVYYYRIRHIWFLSSTYKLGKHNTLAANTKCGLQSVGRKFSRVRLITAFHWQTGVQLRFWVALSQEGGELTWDPTDLCLRPLWSTLPLLLYVWCGFA